MWGALTWVGNDDGRRVVLDLLGVTLGQVRLLLQLLELGLILSPLCPPQLLLSELETSNIIINPSLSHSQPVNRYLRQCSGSFRKHTL